MKSGLKDKIEGTFHEVKGAIKQEAGKLAEKPKLENAGAAEKLDGKIQKQVGKFKTALGK